MTRRGRSVQTFNRFAIVLVASVLVASATGACSSGSGSTSNVTRGVATPSRFVPSRTTTPAEATRRGEWRYQSKTRYHNVY